MEDVIRTELHCHSCSRQFVAELEAGIDGQHVIECPHCGHEHFRVVTDGKITGDRWGQAADNSSSQKIVSARSVWKSNVIQAQTSTVAVHIRERWLNRSDYNGR